MLNYVEQNKTECILISEIYRLGRDSHETLALIRELEEKGVCLYVQNLGITLGADNEKDRIINKLILTILSDIARLESENLSYRIKSEIRNCMSKGLHVGRKVESYESQERFFPKHKQVIKYINLGRSY